MAQDGHVTVVNGVNTPLTGSAYGDLSRADAFKIQKKMLPIAKRLLTFGRFAQKETKPQKEGLEIRHRRYERFPIVDQPLAEGVTPDFVELEQTTLKHTLEQFGSYVNTTDVLLAASTDPVLQIITERQAQQAGETIDFITYKAVRAGSQVGYARSAGSSGRSDVDLTISGLTHTSDSSNTATTKFLDQAIRTLERNDAMKLTQQLDASDGVGTSPIRASYIAVCHTDLRQDLETIPGYVSVEEYGDQSDVMDGEMGSARGIRFIGTTQAVAFKDAGDTTNATSQVSAGTKSDVYPVIILAQDAFGCATLGGKDSLRSKVVLPRPQAGDPLGQRGTVAWDTFYSCVILQDLWMYRLEVAATKF
jgi:N4-gp56 family major capsid protein